MKETIVIANQIITALLWTSIFKAAFHGTILKHRAWRFVHSLLIATLLLFGTETPIGPLTLCIVCSSIFLFLFGERSVTEFGVLFMKNVVTVVLVKVMFLCSAMPVVFIFSLAGAGGEKIAIALIQYVFLEILYFAVSVFLENKKPDTLFQDRSAAASLAAAILFLISYARMKRPYVALDKEFRLYIMLSIVTVLYILGVAFKNDHEKRKEIKSLQDLSLRLVRLAHRYQEMIPSIECALRSLYEEAKQIGNQTLVRTMGKSLEEISGIRKAYGLEAQKERYSCQTFSSTGLIFLDHQLVDEQGRAITNGVTFEVIVQASLEPILVEGLLNQILVQQIIGDLYRNALEAVKAAAGPKAILLILCVENGVYQIRMHDSGALFDAGVLNAVGVRGNSTRGSGHGFADLLEAVSDCSASVSIEEPAPGNSLYAKTIKILFDGLGKLRINSFRREIQDRVLDISFIVEENKRRERSNV